uniref:Uncharacterized protein n=1 Tax=Plectus sambesii TaxID=2011161 RepID=A0A914WYP9_9BILA
VARVSVTTSSSRLRSNGTSATQITVVPIIRPRIIKSRATASASTMGSAKMNGGRAHPLRNNPYAMPNLPSKVSAASLTMTGPAPLLPQKSPKGYQLRPRRSYSPTQLAAAGKDYAADLPPNTQALLGPRKSNVVDGKR